jgi:uncharacterized repeat protein (TIGR01451 family)
MATALRAPNAPAALTNVVTVSGGGDGNALNNTNTLVLSIGTGPDLVIGKTLDGALTQGGTGSFTLLVSNAGGAAAAGAVTVTEIPPAGMTINSMSGTGWAFHADNRTVTRSDALAAGDSYPPVTVSVAIATNAATILTNAASVAGGGDVAFDLDMLSAQIEVYKLVTEFAEKVQDFTGTAPVVVIRIAGVSILRASSAVPGSCQTANTTDCRPPSSTKPPPA